jgi:hypothetical protein
LRVDGSLELSRNSRFRLTTDLQKVGICRFKPTRYHNGFRPGPTIKFLQFLGFREHQFFPRPASVVTLRRRSSYCNNFTNLLTKQVSSRNSKMLLPELVRWDGDAYRQRRTVPFSTENTDDYTRRTRLQNNE